MEMESSNCRNTVSADEGARHQAPRAGIRRHRSRQPPSGKRTTSTVHPPVPTCELRGVCASSLSTSRLRGPPHPMHALNVQRHLAVWWRSLSTLPPRGNFPIPNGMEHFSTGSNYTRTEHLYLNTCTRHYPVSVWNMKKGIRHEPTFRVPARPGPGPLYHGLALPGPGPDGTPKLNPYSARGVPLPNLGCSRKSVSVLSSLKKSSSARGQLLVA